MYLKEIAYISIPAATAGKMKVVRVPADRPPEKVYNDVLDEIISVETAKTIYGVVITESGVDKDATRKLREEMR